MAGNPAFADESLSPEPQPKRFKKAIIQMPCYNEAGTLALALACLPRELPGVAEVEWLVVDDGSTDDTRAVALANGVDHVVSHTQNMGLARTFMTGLSACLELDADIIINTDADNQYNAADMPALIQPILEGKAEYVIGIRPILSIEHFSPVKKLLQRLGIWSVRLFSGTQVGDAPSSPYYSLIFRNCGASLSAKFPLFKPMLPTGAEHAALFAGIYRRGI